MKAIIINESDSSVFPILNKNKDSKWMYITDLISGKLWLTTNSEADIKDAGVNYTIGQIETPKYTDNTP